MCGRLSMEHLVGTLLGSVSQSGCPGTAAQQLRASAAQGCLLSGSPVHHCLMWLPSPETLAAGMGTRQALSEPWSCRLH